MLVSERVVDSEFCLFDKFRAHCPNDKIIMMKYATYGAMRFGNCITLEIGLYNAFVKSCCSHLNGKSSIHLHKQVIRITATDEFMCVIIDVCEVFIYCLHMRVFRTSQQIMVHFSQR